MVVRQTRTSDGVRFSGRNLRGAASSVRRPRLTVYASPDATLRGAASPVRRPRLTAHLSKRIHKLLGLFIVNSNKMRSDIIRNRTRFLISKHYNA